MGDPANRARFEAAKDDAELSINAMAAEFDLAFDGTVDPPPPDPDPTPDPEPTPIPEPTPEEQDTMGRPQSIQFDAWSESYRVTPEGHMVQTSVTDTGEVSWHDHGGGWAPNADVTINRRYAGPPDNPLYNWFTVWAAREDGQADRCIRYWGKVGTLGKPDHWEGPFSP